MRSAELQQDGFNVNEGLYFDGGTDKSMEIVHDVDDKYHRHTTVEEHVSSHGTWFIALWTREAVIRIQQVHNGGNCIEPKFA